MITNPLTEWLSEHPTCECGPLHKPNPRLRRLAHVVDTSSIPRPLRQDLTSDIVIQFSQWARSRKIGFGWWIVPSSLGTTFYR